MTDIEIDELIIGPQACSIFEDFALPEQPDWGPTYGNDCGGYVTLYGVCADRCFDNDWCDVEHYCNIKKGEESGECKPRKWGGYCKFHDECMKDLCLCERCMDVDRLAEMGFKGFGSKNTSSD